MHISETVLPARGDDAEVFAVAQDGRVWRAVELLNEACHFLGELLLSIGRGVLERIDGPKWAFMNSTQCAAEGERKRTTSRVMRRFVM